MPAESKEDAHILISFKEGKHTCVRSPCAVTEAFPDTNYVLAHTFNPQGGKKSISHTWWDGGHTVREKRKIICKWRPLTLNMYKLDFGTFYNVPLLSCTAQIGLTLLFGVFLNGMKKNFIMKSRIS